MNNYSLANDLITALFFIAGVLTFVSSQFIFSTTLFGMAALISNIPKLKSVRI